ncbi:MAG: hypothetical protein ACYC7E_22535 [Armatimonadota bacterium]
MRSLIIIAALVLLWSASVGAPGKPSPAPASPPVPPWKAPASGENLLPDPGFEQPELKIWNGYPGCVELDAAVANTGKHSFRFRPTPERPHVYLTQNTPVILKPLTWYELSYSYRFDPCISFHFGLVEADQQGRRLNCPGFAGSPRAPKPGQFVKGSFRFLTRPDANGFVLYAYASLQSALFLPGTLWLDDLSLRCVATAPAARSAEITLIDGSFESAYFDSGYDFHQQFTLLPSPTAKDGKQVLRKGDERKDASFCLDLNHPGGVELGHVYRASVWARGDGWCFIRFMTPAGVHSPWDFSPSSAGKVFPLDKTEWREIHADLIVDQPGLVGPMSVNVLFQGDVEIDHARLIRLN